MPKMTRRSFLRKISTSMLAIVGTGTGGYYYARNIEPRFLETVRHDVKKKNLPQGFDGIRIAVFSDTHLGFQYDLKQLSKLTDTVMSLKPDMILFAGDLLDNPQSFSEEKAIISELGRLKAPLGKFAVYGNHDHGGYGSGLYKNIIEASGFTLLLNESRSVKLLDGSSIWVAGIDDAMLGKPDIRTAVANIPEQEFTILMSHAPDLADNAFQYGIQLQVSGHSHGGQVKIPFYGPLITPPFATKYTEGFYSVGQDAPMTLYVSRGLGTTRMPFRFLSRPELTLLTLRKPSGHKEKSS
ncbi:metallophosphoesterase [Mesobacillus zeae]|uniref:Metallophosphoesterase n=2 Tax=Mesobacillus zeae TaxID=1917180 RepID=A0A398BKB4_9BACI|nr:metallophosphoesterase [Mesobacillus zeae]RID87823.1 metallophosphoesterase [Mesobacillus zeae]